MFLKAIKTNESNHLDQTVHNLSAFNSEGSFTSIASIATAAITTRRYIKQGKTLTMSDEQISITQRMISACSGSLITSLVVTPFDVIRIRIQQQEILPQNEPCCQKHFPQEFSKEFPKEFPTSSIKPVGMKIPSSATSSLITSSSPSSSPTLASSATKLATSSPELFWIHNHYCNPGAENCTRISSTFQGFATISKHEGITTLWRGLSLTLLMAVPSNIIYFTGYEYLRDHSPFGGYTFNPLLCGALARCMSATFVAPVELIKTRLQSIPADSKESSGVMRHLLKDSMTLMQKNGAGTLFKGLGITLWRDVPFSGIYWFSYEHLKRGISELLKVDFNNNSKTSAEGHEDWKVFTTSFLSGSISGSIAAFFTNPFDVGKTRLQITTDDESGSREGNRRVKRPSMFRFLADIYRKEGVGALYAGFGPRVMKIAPACAIMISSYEIGKKFFKNGNLNSRDG